MNTWKTLQRKTYDVLSHKYFLIGIFPSCVLSVLLLSIIEIGEVWMVWSEKRVNGKLLNVVTGSKCKTLMEIDAVYTWVNGSDPLLIQNLRHYQNEGDEIQPWTECPHADCVPSHLVFYRSCKPLTKAMKSHLPVPYELGKSYITINQSYLHDCLNVSTIVITFSSINDAAQTLLLKYFNRSLFHGFWTTDLTVAGSYPHPQWMHLSGFTSKFPSLPIEMIKKRLSKQLNISILEVWPYPDQGYIVIKLKSAQAVDRLIIRHRKILMNTDVISLNRVNLDLYNPYNQRQDRYAPSRFEDKEELRYSLRSLQQHAPWIRHVYLVTNGQIPYWLNLDHPQITLVTHDEIFPNKSHLPSFSSPAIESHLHRIKGLSEQFLYLNDDIMFAQDVWPEDFHTNSRGYKVYLSWPVPDCSPSCLWSWVSDGTCDSECNVEECGFDGGDCNETDSHPLAHLIREDFSMYDDMASREFPPDFESVVLGKQIAEGDTEYLQPPDLIQSNLHLHRFKNPPKVDNNFGEVAPHNQSKYFNLKLDDGLHRRKRDAVKKNLASQEYFGSSMIAGQSADFLGSVIDSKTAIKEALIVANKLREENVPVLHETKQNLNVTSYASKNFGEANELIKPFMFDHDNDPGESKFVNINFKTGPKPKHDFVDIQPVEAAMAPIEEKNSVHQVIKNLSHLANISTDENTGKLLKSAKNFRNSSVSRRERLRILMENDLNESAVPVTANKVLVKRGKKKMRSLDSFAESLLHVNMLYNRVYGFEARRVPAHAPHFINREIMSKLQEKFSKEWDETSSHRLRSPHDMQFAFSYYYFLMSEEEDISLEEVFNRFDTDHSGTWSDREIRTLLTRIYPAPLNPYHLLQFEEVVLTCAHNTPSTELPSSIISTPLYERYQDSPLPTVTWALVHDCPELKKNLLSHLGKKMKYKFEVVREWSRDVTFKMLSSNVSHLVGYLDDVRRNPKKFVCLNDNLDPKQERENAMVRTVLRDFYHSFFPSPSNFELPLDMRNRFLHVTELNEWKKSRSKLRNAVILAVITLCLLSLAVMCPDEFRHYGRRVFEVFYTRRRRPSRIKNQSLSSSSLSNIFPLA